MYFIFWATVGPPNVAGPGVTPPFFWQAWLQQALHNDV